MKVIVFNGSPRKDGNTSALVDKIVKGFETCAEGPKIVTLFDKQIKGCSNCGCCSSNVVKGHCVIKDDMSELYAKFLDADLVIVASPIYMYQLTPCTLAFLNRLHALKPETRNDIKGKKMAIAVTLGDGSECADSAITGFVDFCEYFNLDYCGMVRIPFAKRDEILDGKYDDKISMFIGKMT
ncbi:MAG: flavodoxin family protein [Candidatus Methanogranum gryphiswaldense]|nr:MAG: flavodoxin family protein [Candidatus Methanogranum sp. U3.2.1]